MLHYFVFYQRFPLLLFFVFFIINLYCFLGFKMQVNLVIFTKLLLKLGRTETKLLNLKEPAMFLRNRKEAFPFYFCFNQLMYVSYFRNRFGYVSSYFHYLSFLYVSSFSLWEGKNNKKAG